jgi:hypothetical protein
MKFLGNILFFLLCSFSVWGQNNITLSGTVLDIADDQPVIAASIDLLQTKSKDTTVVARTITDINGLFSIRNLSAGNYILNISYLSYSPLTKNINLPADKRTVDVGELFLETDYQLLQEIIIEGKVPEVVVRNDTIEFDAASFKTTENAVVEDLLKKLPGVEVGNDGKITVNGREVRRFLVDGKEFFTDDPQIASKNLPAEMVEKLQVFERQSDMAQMTGFNDGEEETTINITVRPGMKQGTIGNALVGVGQDLKDDRDTRYQAGAFLNRMQNNDQFTLILGTNNNNNMGAADLGANQFGGMMMNRGEGGITEATNLMLRVNKELSPTASLNGDFRYGSTDRFSERNINQVTLSEFQSQLDKTQATTNYSSNNFAANFRFEWKPDTMNTFIFRPNFSFNKSHSDELEYSTRFNYNNLDTIFDSNSETFNQGQGYNFGASLDYSRKLSKPGRVISTNLRGNYNNNYSQGSSDWLSHQFENNIYSFDKLLDQRSENDNKTNNFRALFSYVEPLGKNYFLQAIYRIAYRETKNINSTYDMFMTDPLLLLSMVADTALLVPDQSRSTLRNSIDQRLGLNVKMVRGKYNLTVGMNVDPSSSTNETYQPLASAVSPIYLYRPYDFDTRLPNLRGDSLISSIEQNVINFSPIINFRYNFGQRSELRVEYEGSTNQPSASQLRDFTDMTRPTNWVKGNSNLKPGYEQSLTARFQKYVPTTQLMYNINFEGNMSFNDIVSVTEMLPDGVRLTTYENINGNWNTRTRGMFNMPLKNKKFTVGSFAMVYYQNRNSKVDNLVNTMRNFLITNRANITYRSDLFDIGVNVSINSGNITYTQRPQSNQNTLNWGTGGFTTWYLPGNLVIESDVNWSARNGYAEGFNIPQLMWNAAVTKRLFSQKAGTGSLKLQVYDILQDRKNISASSTTNGFRTAEFNVIPSYFMGSFIYKFNSFPTGSGGRNGGQRGDGPVRIEGSRGGGPPPGMRF